MNIKTRLKKIESQLNTSEPCRCPENALATSTAAFTHPEGCSACGRIVAPTAIIVRDLSQLENFNYPVKIYAGFNPDLV